MKGYALDLEEYEPGLVCAAAPVRDDGRAGFAARSRSRVPPSGVQRDRLEGEVADPVTSAADRLSRALGAPLAEA